MTQKFETLIIGLGPAGMAAAIELVRQGVQVAVVDENPEPGGQIYRQPPSDFFIEDKRFLGVRYRVGQDIIAQFNRLSDKMTIFSETMAWGFFEGNTMALAREDHIERVDADKLILCEGAMERSVPFPGWTLPGIMTAGGLQKMIKYQRLLPGKRFVLSGAGPLQLSVAASLVKDGAEVVALCEATRIKDSLRLALEIIRQKKLFKEAVSYLFPILKKSVPIFRPYSVISASGDNRVREVTIARLDANWTPIAGTERTFEADTVGLGYGFLPVARLARLCGCVHIYDPVLKSWKPKTDRFMQTSVANIYTAGDSSGVDGADLAEVEGRIAGIHAAAELGKMSRDQRDHRFKSLFHEWKRIKRYSEMLNRVFSPHSGLFSLMADDTIVCRCERITAREVAAGIKNGYRNINEIKKTRVCLGPCQGRTCESIVTEMMLQEGIPIEDIGQMTIRPPVIPMPGSVFEEKVCSSD